jgi:hypothetical protein
MNRNALITIVVLILIALGLYMLFANNDNGTVPTPTPTTETPTDTQTGQTDTGTTTQNPGSTPVSATSPAVIAARSHLASQLNVSPAAVTLVNASEMTWTDGCLGLGGPAESCLQALVEGYRIELRANNRIYVYRTDATGTAIRAEP